jgi:group I intron endonuclease
MINTPNIKEKELLKPIIRSGKIYLITNLINNKKYVGVTTKTLKRRWRQHVRQSKKPIKLVIHQAIKKHGKSNFKIELIEELQNITEDELLIKESYYIDKYNTWIDNGCGYNMEKYGGGKFFYSDETKKKMSELKGDKNHNADLSIRTFKNLKTNEEFCGNRHAFRRKYNLKQQGVDNVISGWKKSLKGWILVEA